MFTDPASYVQQAKVSFTQFNEFTCQASNADDVYWMYKETITDDLTKDLPQAMEQQAVTTSGGTISRKITDQNNVYKDYRSSINGYYQCYAENTQGSGYKTLAPLIRLIYAREYF